MSRSDENAAEASLELLLDTICNSFGGILFLTILTALLLKISSPKLELLETTPEARLELLAQEQALEEAKQTLHELQAAAELRARQIAQLIPADMQRQFTRLTELEAHLQRDHEQLLSKVEEAAKLQIEVDGLQKKISDLQREREQMVAQLARDRQKVAEQAAAKARTIQPSVTRSSAKLEVILVIKYGRLYLLKTYDRDGLLAVLNEADFIPVDGSAPGSTVSPKPYRGNRIDGSQQFKSRLAQLLARVPPSRWHVGLAIWEDSFAEFSVLRDTLVSLGYEYRVVPIPPDGVVVLGDVTDAQVQ
jgi:hypothetical protein